VIVIFKCYLYPYNYVRTRYCATHREWCCAGGGVGILPASTFCHHSVKESMPINFFSRVCGSSVP